MLLWTILGVFGAVGSAYSENKICITPDGHAGTCVDVRGCAPLLPLLTQKPIPEKDLTLLRQSKCYGPFPYGVCCKIQTDTPSPGPSLPPSQFSSPPLSDGQSAPPAGFSVEQSPDFSLFVDETTTPDPARCTSDHGFKDPSGCCGVDVKSNRGAGVGNQASLEQHPWLALIEYRRNNTVQMLCGGVLISSQYVLTAAHCVTDAVLKVSTPVSVRLGEYDTSSLLDCVTDAGTTRCADAISVVPIEKTIAHPMYDAIKRRDDIALVKLSTPVPYTDYIRPVCLPSTDTPLTASSELRAAGWGVATTKSAVKQNVQLPYVNGTVCQQFYYAPRSVIQLWEKQMCAGTLHSKDSCRSNSGGPLMLNSARHDRFEVVGVASFGPRSCGIDVYTKVSEYVDWIRSEVKI